MKKLTLIFLFFALFFTAQTNIFAQKGNTASTPLGTPDFTPGAIYEIRYWTNMGNPYDSKVYIDTMIFYGNERVTFQYSNSSCLSYRCRTSDSLIYTISPKLGGGEKEWFSGKHFIKNLYRENVKFRGFDRTIYKMFVGDLESKKTGIGDYAFVSKEFGIIFRYNNQNEVFMLNLVEVYKDGKKLDEIDLLPLHTALSKSNIFSGNE